MTAFNSSKLIETQSLYSAYCESSFGNILSDAYLFSLLSV